MRGQNIRSIDRQLISEAGTLLWLSRGEMEVETESEILAAQDQELLTKHHATKILHTETQHYISKPNIGKRTVYKKT